MSEINNNNHDQILENFKAASNLACHEQYEYKQYDLIGLPTGIYVSGPSKLSYTNLGSIKALSDLTKKMFSVNISENAETRLLTSLADYYSQNIKDLISLINDVKLNSAKVSDHSCIEEYLLVRISIVKSKFFELRLHIWLDDEEKLYWHNHRYPMSSLCIAGGYSQTIGQSVGDSNSDVQLFSSYMRSKDSQNIAHVNSVDREIQLHSIKSQEFKPGSIYSLETNQYHNLSKLEPKTITLVFRGRSRNNKTLFLVDKEMADENCDELFNRKRLIMTYDDIAPYLTMTTDKLVELEMLKIVSID